MSQWVRRAGARRRPAGLEAVEPTLQALDEELRRVVADPPHGVSHAEALWPVHQINWQKSRYVYDLYWRYGRISEEVYQYCIDQKLVDGKLMAKWRRPGYEKLCSTYVINPKNYNFGTVSVCRVPRSSLKAGTEFRDQTTGCRGCASGVEGYDNIFGNKYGQRLAKLQMMRESKQSEQSDRAGSSSNVAQPPVGWTDSAEADQSEDDDDNDEDGPAPADAVAASERHAASPPLQKGDGEVGARVAENQPRAAQGTDRAALADPAPAAGKGQEEAGGDGRLSDKKGPQTAKRARPEDTRLNDEETSKKQHVECSSKQDASADGA
mmetsp:Transcript_17589/g.44608  ORF Transcript_17589/g.44608 Transcript_17589/m.44608 type:complete len:323 (-) Transcript_17589:323-1291(-)